MSACLRVCHSQPLHELSKLLHVVRVTGAPVAAAAAAAAAVAVGAAARAEVSVLKFI